MKFQSIISLLSLHTGLSAAVSSGILATQSGKSCIEFPNKLEWKNDWNLSNVAANGNSEVVFYENGDIRFKGRFRASSPTAYNFALSCALRDVAGNTYSLSRKGVIPGTMAQGMKEAVFDETKNHGNVRKWWPEIVKGGKLHCSVKTNVDVKDTLNEVTNTLKQYGPLVGEVIILV
jgi:hypothetical protein